MKTNKTESPKEQRTLAISNFRNLGVKIQEDDIDRRSFLKLNRSLEYDELGGLVLVMGLNNSGKSNVLYAIEKCRIGNYDANDKPDFLTTEDVQPRVMMNIANGAYSDDDEGDDLCTTVINYLREPSAFEEYQKLKNPPSALNNQAELVNLTNQFFEIMAGSRNPYPEFDNHRKTIAMILESVNTLSEFGRFGDNFIDSLKSKTNSLDRMRSCWRIKKGSGVCKYYSKYGYVLNDNVHRYDRNLKPIRETDLKCQAGQVNDFFKTLMTITDVKLDELTSVYSRATEKNGVRKNFEKKCNAKLKGLADDFNNMFTADPSNKYRFELTFETTMMYFTIYRGNIPLGSLDRQSDGFRWIFDFYFNFIKKMNFSAGDIILMDEFGYNLNPKSIKELAIIIRNYAKTFGLTFVIATQNFLIVDTHHLDEVRLVINDPDGNTRIINEFEQFDHEDHDILRPLLDSLTVGRNFMRKEGHRTVFVEGSSDYFFLTAFADDMRKRNEKIDIDFLPINGLGKKDADLKKTISSLINIESYPIVLVDSDGAGKKFKEIAKEMNKGCGKDAITVFELSEVTEDDKTTEIEQMFTEDERKRLNVDYKSFDCNASFAQNAKLLEEISDDTKKKFETLIDNVSLG